MPAMVLDDDYSLVVTHASGHIHLKQIGQWPTGQLTVALGSWGKCFLTFTHYTFLQVVVIIVIVTYNEL